MAASGPCWLATWCSQLPLLLFLLLLGGCRLGDGAQAGSSLLFDGQDDFATVLSGFTLLSDWSLEAWVWPSGTEPLATERCILGLQTFSLRNLLTLTSTRSGAWQVLYGEDAQSIPYTGWLGQTAAYSAIPQHVAITHEVLSSIQCRLQFWVNATLKAQWFVNPAMVAARPEPSLPMLLGACHARGRAGDELARHGAFRTKFFGGHVDELRWWSKVLSSSEIQQAWTWSGRTDRWPTLGPLLQAQYSFDVVTEESLYDGSGHGRLGSIGTPGDPMDSPRYVESAFSDVLEYGSIAFSLRAATARTLDFAQISAAFASTYNGFLIVRDLSRKDRGTSLRLTTGELVGVGSLVAGLLLKVETNLTVDHDGFAFQPCVGGSSVLPNSAACVGQQILDVDLSVLPSTRPSAGPSYAVQLAPEGAYVRFSPSSVNATFEFWVQLSPPLVKGATVFSLQERPGAGGRDLFVWWLDPFAQSGVLEVCTNAADGPLILPLPGLGADTKSHHVALSLEEHGSVGGNWSQVIVVHVDCQLVLNFTVSDPCASLSSPGLWPPTLGQRYVTDEAGAAGAAEPWSQHFCAMYLSEIRLWDHTRDPAALCAIKDARLAGDEPGLVAYAPVTTADIDAFATIRSSLILASALNGTNVVASSDGAGSGVTVEVLCAADSIACPNFALGDGFVVRNSPFELPPEVVTMSTLVELGGTIVMNLAAYDRDNYHQTSLEFENLDALQYEVFEVPDPLCGYVYNSISPFRIIETAKRATFGLPPTATLAASMLPITFNAFEGATVAQQEAMSSTCSTLLKYRVIDSQGLPSLYMATVKIQVWSSGVTLVAVAASNGTSVGLNGSRLLNFTFSGPTSEPAVDPFSLFEVLNGSWGVSTLTQATHWSWIQNGSTLLVELEDAGGGLSGGPVPGETRFRVNEAIGLRFKGDASSAPCSDTSPALADDFSISICSPGFLMNLASGECQACPPGTSWGYAAGVVGAAASCLTCPAGRFTNAPASLACEPCISGRYLPVGSSNRTFCFEAPQGTFVAQASAVETEPCLVGTVQEASGQSECTFCPMSATCSNPGIAVAKSGYFRKQPGASFAKCRNPKACITAGLCDAGVQDVSLGCYSCSKGWTRGAGALRDAGACVQCPDLKTSLGLAGGVLLGTALLCIYLAKLNIQSALHLACLHMFVFKIMTCHLLMMNTFSTMEEWELDAGFGEGAPLLATVLRWFLIWDGKMPVEAIPVDCLLERIPGISTEARLWITLGLWMALPGCLALLAVLLSGVIIGPAYLGRCCWQCCCGSRPSTANTLDPSKVESRIAPSPVPTADSESSMDPESPMSVVTPVWNPSTASFSSTIPDQPDPTAVKAPWQAAWSAEHQRYYYFNHVTGLSTWQVPVLVPSPMNSPGVHRRATVHTARRQHIASEMDSRIWGIWRIDPSSPWATFSEDCTTVVLAALTLSYAPMLRQVMAFLRCDALTGDPVETRLLMAPEIMCGGAEHVWLARVAWLVVLGWGLGLPLAVFILVWQSKGNLGAFAIRARIGLLSMEFEPRYYYWDAITHLRQFAALGAATLAPAAPRTLRLVLLLAIGNVASYIQSVHLPFDNRCGILLDKFESRALKIFSATAASLLLGFSEVTSPMISVAAVLACLLMHLLFIASLGMTFLNHAFQSVAETLVDEEIARPYGKKVVKRCLGIYRGFSERIFLYTVTRRLKMAQICFYPEQNAVNLSPGPAGKPPSDQEQLFLACGISDLLSHVISEFRVERLSVHVIEYFCRRAFASSMEHLACGECVRRYLVAKRPRWARWMGANSGLESERDSTGRRISAKTGRARNLRSHELHDPHIFDEGMAAVDFQGALNTISTYYSKEKFVQGFHTFMITKGVHGRDYELTPHQRLITKFVGVHRGIPVSGAKMLESMVDDEEDEEAMSKESDLQIVDVDGKGDVAAAAEKWADPFPPAPTLQPAPRSRKRGASPTSPSPIPSEGGLPGAVAEGLAPAAEAMSVKAFQRQQSGDPVGLLKTAPGAAAAAAAALPLGPVAAEEELPAAEAVPAAEGVPAVEAAADATPAPAALPGTVPDGDAPGVVPHEDVPGTGAQAQSEQHPEAQPEQRSDGFRTTGDLVAGLERSDGFRREEAEQQRQKAQERLVARRRRREEAIARGEEAVSSSESDEDAASSGGAGSKSAKSANEALSGSTAGSDVFRVTGSDLVASLERSDGFRKEETDAQRKKAEERLEARRRRKELKAADRDSPTGAASAPAEAALP